MITDVRATNEPFPSAAWYNGSRYKPRERSQSTALKFLFQAEYELSREKSNGNLNAFNAKFNFCLR